MVSHFAIIEDPYCAARGGLCFQRNSRGGSRISSDSLKVAVCTFPSVDLKKRETKAVKE